MSAVITLAGHPAHTVVDWSAALTARDLSLDASGLARFPMALAGALVGAQRTATITGLSAEMHRALRIIGANAWLDLGQPTASTLPFSCMTSNDGTLVVRLHPSATTHPGMPGAAAQGWIEPLQLCAIELDFSVLPNVNSVVIAWALQIAHRIQGAPLRVIGANRQVAALFQQLRLDRILVLADT